MKRNLLTPAQAAWLAQTMVRNTAQYGGFTMMADDADAGDGAGDEGSSDKDKGAADTSGDKGFPADTPVAEMKPEEQAAYWRAQAQKHEGRNKEILGITGGKYGDDLRNLLAEADTARREKMTADERAIEDAKRQAREETTREYGPRSVRAAFDLLLGDMPEQERNDEIDLLDLSKFLKQNGDVDTAKVRQFAQKIAPPVKDEGTQRRNYGQGSHTRGQSSGVAAGAEMYAAGRKKSTTNS